MITRLPLEPEAQNTHTHTRKCVGLHFWEVVAAGTPTGPAVDPPSPIACYYLFFMGGRSVLVLIGMSALGGTSTISGSPPPKNIERDINEYVDRKNKDTFFTTNLL